MRPAPLLPFLLLLTILLPVSLSQNLSTDANALLAFRSAVATRSNALNSWNLSNYPCTAWAGVYCSSTFTGPRVTALRLPATALSGAIPPFTLSNLTSLITLSLHHNLLSSPLPSDLSDLHNLTYLYLYHNLFTGELPSVLFSLPSLQHLDLSSNQFSGNIPLAFNNLTRIEWLFLQQNLLSGEIPQMINLPNLAQFNVSYNNLSGPIPASLRKMSASSFLGTKLCGGPLGPCPNEISPSPAEPPMIPTGGGSSNNLSGGAIAGIAVGSAAAALLLLILLILLCRRMKKSPKPKAREAAGAAGATPAAEAWRPAPAAYGGSGATAGKKLVFFGMGERKFDLEDLLRASAEVLGKGTFGTTYKAVLESGITVAVKRLREVSLPEREFREEVSKIGELEHENIVPLRAYYYSKDEKLLVYDFMKMGSLSAVLHGSRGSGRTPLNWETRASIALSAAHGIKQIHCAGPTFSHGNIKSSNILLTTNFDARVSDHGLTAVASPVATTRVTGYRAPEITDPRRISQKADVYSFGVLVLELLTGKAPTQAIQNEEGLDLPRWVRSAMREEGRMAEVFDAELLKYQSVGEEMTRLLQVAMDCTEQYPDNRPAMSEVVARIEEILRVEEETGREGSSRADDSIEESRADA